MLLETIIRLAAGHCDADPASITPESDFKSLELDSLDITEIILDLEEEFGVNIDYTVDKKVKTVGELAAYVEELIG